MVLPATVAGAIAGTWHLLNNTPTYLNGSLRPAHELGYYPKGLLIYDAQGYMSANIITANRSDLPPNRAPDDQTDADLAQLLHHSLAYSGELHAWEGSNASMGTLTHGPLMTSTAIKWLGTNQTRNYRVSKGVEELGGKDMLHLWLAVEKDDSVANLRWVRDGRCEK